MANVRYTKRQWIVGTLIFVVVWSVTFGIIHSLVSISGQRHRIALLAGIVLTLSFTYIMRRFFGKES